MSIQNKNTAQPVSDQDISDATYFAEHRLDYLVFDDDPKKADYQRQEWLERQDSWRGQIKEGDPIVIRSLADQLRQQQELEQQRQQRRQRQQRQLGHLGMERSVAA